MAFFEGNNMTGGYGDGPNIINSCSINVDKGEIVAILGPNGAGKSTAMKAMLGLLNLKSGSVVIEDQDISKFSPQERVQRGISFVPQTKNVFSELTVRENLEIGGFLRKDDIDIVINQIYELFPILAEKRDQVVGQLSGGQRQQVALGRALMSEPSVLMLDEPTAGVDIELRRSMWNFLTEINKSGTTIILTTHYLEEAESLCRNIAIIDHGKIIENTSMKSLLKKLDKETFVFDLAQEISVCPKIKGYSITLSDRNQLEVEIPKSESLNGLFAEFSKQKLSIVSMRNKTNRLEELFIGMVEKNLESEKTHNE